MEDSEFDNKTQKSAISTKSGANPFQSAASTQKKKSSICFLCQCFFSKTEEEESLLTSDDNLNLEDEQKHQNNYQSTISNNSSHLGSKDTVYASAHNNPPIKKIQQPTNKEVSLSDEGKGVNINNNITLLVDQSNQNRENIVPPSPKKTVNKANSPSIVENTSNDNLCISSQNTNNNNHSNNNVKTNEQSRRCTTTVSGQPLSPLKRDSKSFESMISEVGGTPKPKKQKFNIKRYFQQILSTIQSGQLMHLFSPLNEKQEASYLLIKLNEQYFYGGVESNASSIASNNSGSSSASSNSSKSQKSFRSDFDSQFFAVPEQISGYVATRLKDKFVVDAFCGAGHNTVQFAKEACYLIGVDLNQTRLQHAKYNLDSRKQRVDLIQSDFFALPRLKADVIVLHPDYMRRNEKASQQNEDRIDLFTDVVPDLVQSLQHAFTLAESVVLFLHKNCDITQLPQVLDKVNFARKKFSLEIDLMHIDKQFTSCVAFIGEIADVAKKEEIDYYLQKLYESTNFSNSQFEDKLRLLLIHLRDQKKISGLSQMILECEKAIDSPSNRKTLFQEFFDYINDKKEARVRSSESMSLDSDQQLSFNGAVGGADNPKQILQEIQQIIMNNGINPSKFPQIMLQRNSHSMNFDHDSSFSFQGNSSHFHFHPSASHDQSNNMLNNLLNTFNNIKSSSAFDEVKDQQQNINKKQIVSGLNQNKRSLLSATDQSKQIEQRDEENNDAQEYDDDYKNQQQMQKSDIQNKDYQEEDNMNVYYSCSYNAASLALSDGSDQNSLRPQLSNDHQYYNKVGVDSQSQDQFDDNSKNYSEIKRRDNTSDFPIQPFKKTKSTQAKNDNRKDSFNSFKSDDICWRQLSSDDDNEEGYHSGDENSDTANKNNLKKKKEVKKEEKGNSTEVVQWKNYNTFQVNNDFEEPIKSAKNKDIFTLPNSFGS